MKKNKLSDKVLTNSLTELVTQLGYSSGFGVQLSQTATLIKNNRTYFISNDWSTLTYSYTTHGIIQTFIDMPIEDAFRGGIKLKSDELSAEELLELELYIKNNDIDEAFKEVFKWVRLYGGGALIINTVGNADKPLNINQINKDTPLTFYAADPWELNKTNNLPYSENKPYLKASTEQVQFYPWGMKLDGSRLILMKGKRAPSLARGQLRGWGMSELERVIRSLNSYLKNQDLIFELIDEAVVDIFKVDGFNQSLSSAAGVKQIQTRIELANKKKNFLNAIVMDSGDGYEQKKINFAGLAEIHHQNMIGIASDLRQPMTKLFGISASGFNSGEDDIENYNATIESEIRGKADHMIIRASQLISKKLFDIVPSDLEVVYQPLRILSTEQEENVNQSKITNLMALYDRRIINAKQSVEEINKQSVFDLKLDVPTEDFPLMEESQLSFDQITGGEKKDSVKAEKPKSPNPKASIN